MGTSAGQLSNSNVTILSSPIISNPECSPFVIICSEGNDGSSISFIDVVHRSSELRTLLPLTAISLLNSFTSSHLPCVEMNADVSVSCSGLSIDDACLVLGTGPLLSNPNTPSTEQNEVVATQLAVESSLVSSRLLNTTSLPRCSALPCEVWLSQQIVGSCVDWSSNHLCGTGCVDMNSGESLVCSNTSFTHCHSPLTPEHPDTDQPQLRHLPHQDRVDTNRTTLNTIAFSGCSFCDVSARTGALFLSCHSPNRPAFSLSSSTFMACSAQFGGSVTLSGTSSLSISDSVFHRSRTATRSPLSAHAVDLLSNGPASLCNVLFVDCCHPHSEGAVNCVLRLADCFEFVLDSVMFRGANSSEGKDVVLQDVGSLSLLATRITNCDSTTGAWNCLIVDEDRLDSTLIPHPMQEASISRVSCNPVNRSAATLQMLTESAVEGRMIALVGILDGSTTPNDDSRPHFHRLLIFNFPELGTQSAPTSVCLDEWDELKFGAEFRVVVAAMPNTTIFVKWNVVSRPIDISRHSTRTQPNCIGTVSLNKEKTHVTITLIGEDLSAQPFYAYVEMNGTNQKSLSTITFVSETELTVEYKGMYYQTSNALIYGETYTLVSVNNTYDDFEVNPSLTFTVPNASVITALSHRLTNEKTHLLLELSGKNCPSSGTCILTLNNVIQIPITFTNGKGNAEPIPLGPSFDLDYSTTYTMNSLVDEVGEHLLLMHTNFTTAKRPSLTSFTITLDETNPDYIRYTLIGSEMPYGSSELNVTEAGESNIISLQVDINSVLNGSGLLKVYNTSGGLKYGKTYNIDSFSNPTSGLVFAIPSPISFTTPPAPARIESFGDISLNKEKTEVTVQLIGVFLSDKPFFVIVNRSSTEFASPNEIDWVSDSEINVVFNTGCVESTPTLQYGLTYQLKSVKNDIDSFLVNTYLSFKVPNAPIVTTISSKLSSNLGKYRDRSDFVYAQICPSV
ncbi:hypothetical protein BLNAU_9285 [Blattamonas nauphoetae]|uniref:Uncharacterized protein n=1 Tax=Blattamonas nauphoetae TaxID=2049346 RepID=A0ABQ9XW97_9EUKA|nr:hypothetical protein BLNAU_9285 [Blattamonas nauphoetae]